MGAGATGGGGAGTAATGGGVGTGAGATAFGATIAPSHPAAAVAGVHAPSRQQSSLLPFRHASSELPLRQLSTDCAPALARNAAQARRGSHCFLSIMSYSIAAWVAPRQAARPGVRSAPSPDCFFAGGRSLYQPAAVGLRMRNHLATPSSAFHREPRPTRCCACAARGCRVLAARARATCWCASNWLFLHGYRLRSARSTSNWPRCRAPGTSLREDGSCGGQPDHHGAGRGGGGGIQPCDP